jgi:hypothetical protein
MHVRPCGGLAQVKERVTRNCGIARIEHTDRSQPLVSGAI